MRPATMKLLAFALAGRAGERLLWSGPFRAPGQHVT